MTASSSLLRRSSKLAGPRQVARFSWESTPTAILMTVMTSGVCWSRNCALCIICFRCSNAFGRWLGSPQREACGRRRWISSSRTSLLQKLRLQKICIREVITNRSVCRGHMYQVLCSSSKRKRSHWPGGLHKRRHNIMSCTSHSPSTCLWGPRSGEIQQAFEKVMGDVSREWEGGACGPLTEIERRFDDARSRLRDLTSSTVLQGCNCSSLGDLLPHESLDLHMVQRQKRMN